VGDQDFRLRDLNADDAVVEEGADGFEVGDLGHGGRVPVEGDTSQRRAVAGRPVGSSVVEDHEVELPEALGVGEEVDFDDLPARNRKAEYHTRLSARSPHSSRGAVDECALCEARTS